MLDSYAHDPMGGGEGLREDVKQKLVAALAQRPHAFSLLAFDGELPVGLVNCFEGFSTFAAKPLVNIHDVAVLPAYRGKGVAQLMMAEVERIAVERGCCKLTLEVLGSNQGAKALYQKLGYGGYQLGSATGVAEFWQKKLAY
ncbi:MAG: GNAT family N-acetyltransferase [Burkholderiaceae bacterium]|nr:GNAT family N-acetyltransferase [Burkholderiaceae bacterium]